MDETLSCCCNCKFSSGSSGDLYCYKTGVSVYEYAACFMYEEKIRKKANDNEGNSINKQ